MQDVSFTALWYFPIVFVLPPDSDIFIISGPILEDHLQRNKHENETNEDATDNPERLVLPIVAQANATKNHDDRAKL